MTFALDPRIVRVWRTPDSLQFGVDQPVLVLTDVSAAEERMLAALADGVTSEGLAVIAARAGAASDAPSRLLQRVAPVLARPRPAPAAAPLVVLDGAGPTASAIEWMLKDAGAEVRAGLSRPDSAIDAADVAVIVASYAVEPQRHARWLRRDVPHLPVVLGDAGTTVGPLVRPGTGPCLRCADLHRTDGDPAWPAMASQLYTRPAPGENGVAVAATASRAAALVLAASGAEPDAARTASVAPVGVSWRLEAGAADWVSRVWQPHRECGCLVLPS